MAGHLLVLERLAGILTTAGRADGAVRDRYAVRSAQPAEIPPLHAAGKALADRGAGNVHKLANDEMIGGDLRPDRNDAVIADAEFRNFRFRFDLGRREASALGAAHVLHLSATGAELQRHIAVLVLRAMGHDLAVIQTQDGNRYMLTAVGEHPGHSHLLRDHTGTH